VLCFLVNTVVFEQKCFQIFVFSKDTREKQSNLFFPHSTLSTHSLDVVYAISITSLFFLMLLTHRDCLLTSKIRVVIFLLRENLLTLSLLLFRSMFILVVKKSIRK
jgi:hypothetical protein